MLKCQVMKTRNLRVLGVIPARAGSKRVLNKNKRLLGTKPLIVWSIDSARESKVIDHIVVSTDSEEIKQIALDSGADVPFIRTKKLSQDDSPAVDVIIDVIKNLEQIGKCYDIVLILQPTTPFRKVETIKDVVSRIKEDRTVNGIVGVKKIKDHPELTMFSHENGDLIPYFDSSLLKQRTQSFNEACLINGSIYAFRINEFTENKHIIFEGVKPHYTVEECENIDIDTEEDFKEALNYIKQKE